MMDKHLSSQDIAEWTIGEYNPEVEQHLSDCSMCRAELAMFKLALSQFRDSAHAWADDCRPSVAKTLTLPYRSRRFATIQAAVLAIAIAACLLSLFSIQHHTQALAYQPVIDDTALLQSVTRDLSETLPTSFVPL